MNKIGKIGFLGGGRIAQAMANGFISAGIYKIKYINFYTKTTCLCQLGLTKAESIIASVHPADSISLQSFKVQKCNNILIELFHN